MGTHREKTYTILYIEHRAGKAARLASWRKMTRRASFVGDGGLRVFPMRAHFPWNETLDSLSTLTSYVLHLPSRVKSRTASRGQWGMGTQFTKNLIICVKTFA
jgi:hypothetical protein